MKHLRTTAVSLVAVCLATGCGIAAENKKYDYKTPSGTATAKALEIPPELTPLPPGGLVAPGEPGANENKAPTPADILPAAQEASVERDGNQRWLLIKQPAEKVWPTVVQFWKEQGFQLVQEDARTGIIETDWAEDRGRLPNDIVRRTFGSSLDKLFSSGQKDRYRTRLERCADGNTEVFISHMRKVEDFTDSNKNDTRWFIRPADPEAEAAMLSQLLLKFGVPEAKAESMLANKPADNDKAKSQPDTKKDAAALRDLKSIEIEDSFDRTWRRVGLTLDRNGFTVTDRDRSHGLYFIRYADPDSIRSNGIFGMLFGDKDTRAEDYQLEILENAGKCSLRVLDKDGKAASNDTAKRILNLLQDKLK